MNLKHLIFVQIFLFSIQLTMCNPKFCVDVARIGLNVVRAIVTGVTAINNYESKKQIKVLLEELVESSQRIESTIKTEAQRVIDELSVEINMLRVHDFKVAVDDINSRYSEDFEKLFMSNVTYERQTFERFVNARDEFKRLRRSIQHHTVPTHVVAGVTDDRMFEIMHGYLMREANNKRQCQLGISHHKILYEAYNTAVLAVAKVTIMILYSYKYLQQENKNAWKSEIHDAEAAYIQTVANISETARNVMARASRVVSRCDPSTYRRGESYINYSFKSLFMRFPNILGLGRDTFLYPWQRSEAFCDGVISDCTDTRVIRACLAAPESGRRYETIIEQGGIFDYSWYYKGPTIDESECQHDPMIAPTRQGVNQACICTEPSTLKKNAFLNTSAVHSDVANNRVITGVRLRTRWSVTYLEIQEGEMVNGTVLADGVRWRDDVTRRLEDYERRKYVLPDDVILEKDATYIGIPHGMIDSDLAVLVNLRSSETKFNLDDIILPEGMVVTGVKFEKSQYFGISLMVEGTRLFDSIGNFDFSSQRQWFSSDSHSRKQINLNYCGDPLRGPKLNKELSTPGESSVVFRLSDWNRDGSQSLIPFIDLQEVATSPPSPIGGLGIFYKGQDNYGGFISLKILDIDDTIFMFRGWFLLRAIFQRITGSQDS